MQLVVIQSQTSPSFLTNSTIINRIQPVFNGRYICHTFAYTTCLAILRNSFKGYTIPKYDFVRMRLLEIAIIGLHLFAVITNGNLYLTTSVKLF